MEHAHLEELVGSNQYVADEGYVITNYKEGDSQIVYSPALIFMKGTELKGFYTMSEFDASTLADQINPKHSKQPKHDNFEEDIEEPIKNQD